MVGQPNLPGPCTHPDARSSDEAFRATPPVSAQSHNASLFPSEGGMAFSHSFADTSLAGLRLTCGAGAELWRVHAGGAEGRQARAPLRHRLPAADVRHQQEGHHGRRPQPRDLRHAGRPSPRMCVLSPAGWKQYTVTRSSLQRSHADVHGVRMESRSSLPAQLHSTSSASHTLTRPACLPDRFAHTSLTP